MKMEGTYKLEWRKLPDGTIVRPPDVTGLLSYSKNYRNFNVMWKDREGKVVSISSAARYKLSKDSYTETNIYYMMNDPAGGKGPEYDLSDQSSSAEVKKVRGHLEFRFPLHDEPSAVIEGDELVALREGEFEDHWKKVA